MIPLISFIPNDGNIKVITMRIWSVIVLCLLLLASVLVLPVPSLALDYGKHANLSNAPASFRGESVSDASGCCAAMAGDVNGDGFDDILIGSPGNDDSGADAGQAYLILGKATGWSKNVDLSNADASFLGERANDNAGLSVAGAGDVNGDGFDDLLIGASQNDDGGSNAGQTYLVLGKATGWAMNTGLATANASFWGETANDESGNAVAGAGDVNGDGFDDILIGAYLNDDGGSNAGQTYLVLGKATGWAMDTDLSKSDASFWGENADDGSGDSVNGAGDVNNDGLDDILIGAQWNDDGGTDAGQTYLVLGKASGWAMDTDLSKADASFWGENAGDRSGVSVDGSGDVNGDGYDDILIGALGNDDSANAAGQTYLVLGKSSGWAMDTDLSVSKASFRGEVTDDQSGSAVAGAGDVDGDGFDDILVGAHYNEFGGMGTGQTYLFRGKSSGWAMDTSLFNANCSFLGENVNDQSPDSLDGAGDVNGDGHDDILLGTWMEGSGSGKTYLIFPDGNAKPSIVTSVKAYTDASYTTEDKIAFVNDTEFIELRGTDGDPLTIDTAVVNVTSYFSSPMGFPLRLRETGKNTGIYRGDITIKNRTHDRNRWINASDGEIVTVKSVQDPSKYATIFVGNGPRILPYKDVTTAVEDEQYNVHYWAKAPSLTWTFSSNASWLAWDPTAHNISGLPTNKDVGSYSVSIIITYPSWGSDQHNFVLTVENTPPLINSTDVKMATEDKYYRVDYNSSEDGQGTVTWHLKTNCSAWLSIVPNTGVLDGTPPNEDVGKHYVNVSVDDGHGGWAHSNFTLTVANTNDLPKITTSSLPKAYEDSQYNMKVNATDVDIGDPVTWAISTNASKWVLFDQATGVLSGVPRNEDVGSYWVNVTVLDKAKASDHHNFTLAVMNTNDLPTITSIPVLSTDSNDLYQYDVNATDVDVGDILSYSLHNWPDNMTIDGSSGLIKWRPTPQQKGANLVVVKVSDGHASVTQRFNVTVIVTWPPTATLVTPPGGSDVLVLNPQLTWTWEDADSAKVTFSVFLSKDRDAVRTTSPLARIAGSLAATSLSLSNLEKGATYYWTVIPNDGLHNGTCTSGIWYFTVSSTATNDKEPVITSTPVTTAYVKEPYKYDVEAKDIDTGDILTYALTVKPDNMTIDPKTGLITWTPAVAQFGNQSVTVTVSDGKALVSQTFMIKVLKGTVFYNHKPEITAIPDRTVVAGDKLDLDVKAQDPDAGDHLIYGLDDPPAGMTISSVGAIQWSPTSKQVGDHTITVNVSDGKEYMTAQFKITVKKRPTSPTILGLDAMMFGIIAVVIAVVVGTLAAVFYIRKRKKDTLPPPPNVAQQVQGPPQWPPPQI